ncbi:uncharacterized protein LOC115217382 isoform X1 [Octopus sinensis]|uniref:Uncharacterized protein LOC115217382 isoform X1 n=1 Tax=Octopus sinensis TaxID=2607531 RepID=A0A7E6F6A8_9MOLL|nr:uncharacterized protein LOC115217382 isoform X1 [Octopus sinensis]
MWHKIWDTAVGFHKRYIRPVWNRAPYSKLKEICDESEVEMSTTGVYCASVTDTSISNEPPNVNRIENKTPNSSVSAMSMRQGFDEPDAGFHRSDFPIAYPSSITPTKNSTITDIKNALSAKRPSYHHVQEEADKIEVLGQVGYQSVNLECTATSEHKGSSDHIKQCQTSPDVEVPIEEITPSSAKIDKKLKSRRKRILRKIKRCFIMLWKYFKAGKMCPYAYPPAVGIFSVYPQDLEPRYVLG